MTRMELTSRVGTDGVLSIRLPIGLADADREVKITVEPVSPATDTAEESDWHRFLDETAGAWSGEKLVRPEQGEFEKRREWP